MKPARAMASARNVALALVVGLGTVLGGWVAARGVLPEWRQPPLPSRERVAQTFRRAVAAAGLAPIERRPDLRPATDHRALAYAYAHLGGGARDWLLRTQCALPVEASSRVRGPGGDGGESELTLQLCGDLTPEVAQSMAENWFQSAGKPFLESPVRERVRAMLVPATTDLGPAQPMAIANTDGAAWQLPAALERGAPEVLQVVSFPGPGAAASRVPGTLRQAIARSERFSWAGLLLQILPSALVIAGVGVLFIVLLLRRHVDFLNALVLATVALVGTAGALGQASSSGGALSLGFQVVLWLGRAVAVFVLWTAAESWLRSTLPGFTTSLDAVRAGRLGPRAGRAILGGWGLGAALAGVQLLCFAAAAVSGAAHPKDTSVTFAVLAGGSPFAAAPLRAGLVVLAMAAARRVLPPRWVPWGAIVLAALLQEMPALEPWPARLAASLLTASVLVLAHQAFGLTALLATAFNAAFLPVALFGAQQPEWLAVPLAVCGAGSLALLLVGVVASSLKHDPASERAATPRFVRRLEDERRMRYEMDLLTRMQLGLLPAALPELPGWSVAARSLLANEVGGDLYDFVRDGRGRWWIAAGDVSGHGFSCAITQAMTKAALVSLVYSAKTPSEVLGEMDRVLRTAGDVRNFASLALVRLDPETGEALMANAGHPFPLLRDADGVREVALPGLPLGRGPERVYTDVPFVLRPGDALVLASDGLFEAVGQDDEPYGYDRGRGVLGSGIGGSAAEVVEHLLADWTRFRAGRPPMDDTTLVVLRRRAS